MMTNSGAGIRCPAPLFLLLAVTFACRPAIQGTRTALHTKLSPDLRAWLAADTQSHNAEHRRVLIDLTAQLDFSHLADSLLRTPTDRLSRRRAVLAALAQVAAESQQRLFPLLEQLEQHHAIDEYRAFTIVNRFAVTATADAVLALAAHPEVAAIVAETPSASPVLSDRRADLSNIEPFSWALNAINVRSAWHQGLDGRGVVVGLIDAGASVAHEQLRANF